MFIYVLDVSLCLVSHESIIRPHTICTWNKVLGPRLPMSRFGLIRLALSRDTLHRHEEFLLQLRLWLLFKPWVFLCFFLYLIHNWVVKLWMLFTKSSLIVYDVQFACRQRAMKWPLAEMGTSDTRYTGLWSSRSFHLQTGNKKNCSPESVNNHYMQKLHNFCRNLLELDVPWHGEGEWNIKPIIARFCFV